MEDRVERFGVSMTPALLRSFDERIKQRGYKNRSEAIRDIVRSYLVEGEWEAEGQTVVGTVTIVYSHHTRELTNVLTELQHEFAAEIVCSTHIHLDEHNCLEVIIVRGESRRVRTIADRLISTRGVKHGRLVSSTTGKALA